MDLTKIHLPLRDPSICLPSGIGKTHETSSVPRHYPGEALDLQHLDGSKDLGMRDSPQKGDQAEALFYLDKRSKHILVPESLDAKKGPNHPTIRAVRDILRFCLPQGKSPNKNTIDMETPIFFPWKIWRILTPTHSRLSYWLLTPSHTRSAAKWRSRNAPKCKIPWILVFLKL